MHSLDRTIPIVVVTLTCVLFSLCSGTAQAATPGRKHPTAVELLDKYAQTQDKLGSFVVKGTSSAHIRGSYSSPQWKAQSGRKKKHVSYELRFDGRRFNWRRSMWGNIRSPHEFIWKNKSHYKSVLWDGAIHYNYAKAPYIRSGPGEVKINKVPDAGKVKNTIADIPHICAPMFGFFEGERIDSVLRRAKNISVRDKTETIGGAECYVIDATAPSGKYTVWIDPDHGYSIARAEVRRAENDLLAGEHMAKGHTLFTSLRNVRFENIRNVWIPMEADVQMTHRLPTGDSSKYETHYKRSEFAWNPDHEALGSFRPTDIENGTRVRIVETRGKGRYRTGKYTWQNGKVVDEAGKVVLDCTIQKPVEKTIHRERLGQGGT